MGKVAESDTARRMNHDAPLRTSELILGIGNSQTGESVSLEELLEGFHHRAFGVRVSAALACRWQWSRRCWWGWDYRP
jgi:hypothetical protein